MEAGDPDYQEFGRRMEENPEEAFYHTIPEGLKMISEDRYVCTGYPSLGKSSLDAYGKIGELKSECPLFFFVPG